MFLGQKYRTANQSEPMSRDVMSHTIVDLNLRVLGDVVAYKTLELLFHI